MGCVMMRCTLVEGIGAVVMAVGRLHSCARRPSVWLRAAVLLWRVVLQSAARLGLTPRVAESRRGTLSNGQCSAAPQRAVLRRGAGG